MKNDLFLTCVIICIITHIIRTVYEILKHRKIIIPGKLSFQIILVNMMLLWISWFLLCRFDTYRIDLFPVIRYTGLFLTAAGIFMFFSGLSTIKTLESYEGDLITSGIYSKIRHPMYLGFIFWLIGFPVFTGGALSFLLAMLFVGNVLFWRYLEELELKERFPLYPEYIKSTIF